MSALDAELDAETHLLESSVAKFTLASHNMESFGHILDETFNAAGCSDELIIGLLGELIYSIKQTHNMHQITNVYIG